MLQSKVVHNFLHDITHNSKKLGYIYFIKYCFIGLSGGIIDFIVFYVLVNFAGINFIVANIISSALGITNNFLLNAHFNFRVKDKLKGRFIKFTIVALIGITFNTYIVSFFFINLKINLMFSKVIALFTVALFQFVLNKKYTFKSAQH